MENQTIDKKTFRMTYGQAITLILFIISTTAGIYTYLNGYSSKIDTVNAKVDKLETSVNNKLDIVTITQKNQYQSTKNDRKRDSTDAAIRFKVQDEKLNEVKNLLYRMSPYNQRPLSSN